MRERKASIICISLPSKNFMLLSLSHSLLPFSSASTLLFPTPLSFRSRCPGTGTNLAPSFTLVFAPPSFPASLFLIWFSSVHFSSAADKPLFCYISSKALSKVQYVSLIKQIFFCILPLSISLCIKTHTLFYCLKNLLFGCVSQYLSDALLRSNLNA